MKNTALLDVLLDEIGGQRPQQMPCLRRRAEGSGLLLSYPDPGHAIRRHTLNRMSREIYDLCDGDRSIRDIRDRMHGLHPSLELEQITEHVLRAVRLMQRKRILSCP